MAKFKSKYAELSFYSNGERKKFSKGEYSTTDKKDIVMLDSLIDAIRIDEPKQEKKSEDKPKQTQTKKPAITSRKSSAK